MSSPLTNLSTQKYISGIDQEIKSILGDEIPILSRLKEYTVKSGGKRVRSLLTCFLAESLGEMDDEIYSIAAIVEIIHAASLLHDDVLDNSAIRRGKPSGKTIFGSKEVILGGDYMLACAIRRLNRYENPAITEIFTRVIRDLSISELIQMEYAGNGKISMNIYYQIIYGKTASLFQTACEAVAIYTQKSSADIHALSDFGKNLGLLFQIRDDYLDYFNSSLLKKPPFQDFENGYYTYPVLAARDNGSEDLFAVINEYLQKTPEERKEKSVQNAFLKLITDNGAEKLTRNKLTELLSQLHDEITRLPEGEYRKKIENQINGLMNFL